MPYAVLYSALYSQHHTLNTAHSTVQRAMRSTARSTRLNTVRTAAPNCASKTGYCAEGRTWEWARYSIVQCAQYSRTTTRTSARACMRHGAHSLRRRSAVPFTEVPGVLRASTRSAVRSTLRPDSMGSIKDVACGVPCGAAAARHGKTVCV